MKILLTANIPEALEFEWFKHVREFDVAHPGCLFQIVGETAQSTDEIIQLMHVVGFGVVKKLAVMRKIDRQGVVPGNPKFTVQ